jgi:glycosyltransferase involved in cell wall biosynthesis
VDDGSTDGTRSAVMAAMEADPRVRLVAYDTKHGKANAVRAGFDTARNDVLMILDADMSVAPEDLPKFLEPLENGTAEFVNGTRLVYPREGRAMPTVNFLGNKAFCFLVSWVLRQRVSDTLCGTKALLRRDYESMPLSGRDRWGDFDLLFGAGREKLRVLEVPIHYRERVAGESKMNVTSDGLLFLRACLAGWRMLRRPASVPWATRVPPAEGAREISLTRVA